MAILIGSHFFCFINLFICKLIIFVYICAYNGMQLNDRFFNDLIKTK